jgi:ABC-type branched-subunit amino acid transport system ATPase component
MILNLKNIRFGFSSEKLLFDNLSLTLEENQVHALMGSNGAGKTTLFNIICGYYKPTKGTIDFGKKSINNHKPFIINRIGIGRTFQDLRIISKLTVQENIILSMKDNPSDNWVEAMFPQSFNNKVSLRLIKKANEIAEQFFLSEVNNSLGGEISYGQQKLLTLACCVANGATLLLLDEPVAGIQPEFRNKIVILIKQLKEAGKSVFLIEHNTDFIANVCDKIFFLHEGEIATFDNIEALRKESQIMEAYI